MHTRVRHRFRTHGDRWLTVGWSIHETLHASIALEALDMAIRRQRPAPGLIQHSDRGIQYAADEYRQALAAAKKRSPLSSVACKRLPGNG
ncbi:putative transposase OrfB [Jannaschia seosinensis]|uniref:Putative transposase OrfB n=1 Tax=Jannaschia seosinensis TaxID=313367 RepID=A0A0M7B8Y9_9RHOB|nr:hypothetical protein [Jannaschia seosinensis]CUH39190.1 putative transposase OrfB [Jannaschia seosinensis]